jgi:predicted enzyme related to lactoylglutathione lyase
MSAAFMAFARTGVPGAPGLPPWPAYDPAGRATMVFDSTSDLVHDPFGDERRALAALRRRRVGLIETVRLHFIARDLEATAAFWAALGAARQNDGDAVTMTLAGLQIRLTRGTPTGSSDGSVVNHVSLRTPELAPLLARLDAVGVRTERPAQFPGTANAFTPDGDKVEIFDNTSSYPGFEADGSPATDAWKRHNRPVTEPIAIHHLHFYVPVGQETRAREWYRARFGGTPGRRFRYDAVDYPAINLNFSAAPAAVAPTAGRTLDRIGFDVRGLEVLASAFAREGGDVVAAYRKESDGSGRAIIRDPWGTTIELREQLQ